MPVECMNWYVNLLNTFFYSSYNDQSVKYDDAAFVKEEFSLYNAALFF